MSFHILNDFYYAYTILFFWYVLFLPCIVTFEKYILTNVYLSVFLMSSHIFKTFLLYPSYSNFLVYILKCLYYTYTIVFYFHVFSHFLKGFYYTYAFFFYLLPSKYLDYTSLSLSFWYLVIYLKQFYYIYTTLLFSCPLEFLKCLLNIYATLVFWF